MKKIIILITIMLIMFGLIFSDRVGTLSEVMKPDNISVFQDDLYVIEGATIYIYSLKDLQLQKKIGKRGEGPGELKAIPAYPNRVTGYPEYILVESPDKIVFYSREGNLIKEKRKPSQTTQIIPIGKNYVVKRLGPGEDNRTAYSNIYIYNSNMKKVKRLYSQKWVQQGGTPPAIKLDMVVDFINIRVYENKLFIDESPGGFLVEVFDQEGNKLYNIKKPVKLIKVTKEHRKQLIEDLKEDPWVKPQIKLFGGWNEAKKLFTMNFHDYFPAIQNIEISDNHLFIQTSRIKNDKDEYLIMGLKGENLKKVLIPRMTKTSFMSKIMGVKLNVIHNNKLYYLKENEDEEEWELHVEKIEF